MTHPTRAPYAPARLLSAGALALAALCSPLNGAHAAAKVGEPAPAFQAIDAAGAPISLAQFKGKVVVLEWTNHECPYVRKQYDHGAMQALQREAAADGFVWLSVVSSAPGEQGYVTGAEATALSQRRGAQPTAVVLDPEGVIGRAYGAKTTPHMYVIDPRGVVVYMGAIDDDSSSSSDPAKARNYVHDAMAAVKQGKAASPASTQPYGCSVKYRS